MTNFMNSTRSIFTVIITLFLLSTSLIAQDASKKADEEMKSAFGTVPVMFDKLPAHVKASAWEWFKAMSNPEAAIPPKYGELIGLGVAAQIPCNFCVYAHTTMAKMYGATDEEIQEAVSKGAEVRHWSTILNGNHVEFEAFKKEWDGILAYVKEQSEKKQK